MAKAKYTKQANGYFQARVWDGTYRNGKKHYVMLRSRKSSKDLEQMVNDYNEQVRERRMVRNRDVMFLEYAKRWLNVYKSGKSNATKAMYENIIKNHMLALSEVKVIDVAQIHYQTIMIDSQGKTRTQQQIKQTFKQIMRSAVRDKLYPENLFEELEEVMEPIRYRAAEKRVLTESEKKALFSADLSPMDKCFVNILYGCGLRRGEALALTRFDVDLKNKTININKAVEFVSNTSLIKEPKSHNGFRKVPIPPVVLPYIENYMYGCSGYLFTCKDGELITKNGFQRMWNRILSKLKEASDDPIVGLTPHVFRHNYCSNLCYQIPRISIKKIAELLGDTEGMVLKVYNHIVLEKEDSYGAVADALNVIRK